eukprot:CAMPEP_0180200464 /NCGR_PEP_ID=MMETSP0987-20121128/6245_1 /TAXON_ID=697907 /ORGANISM="non described non described, Strain CCMP2293" /LENGTH=888 /DNA_ID=CAMNT_0022155595 /DNA_START=231 /DNA_END=2893 /DNA_ORIENTATION=-
MEKEERDHARDEKKKTKESEVMLWLDKADGKEYKLSFEHVKLLYLVSHFGRASKSEEQPETWIRELPLCVLIYEGIVAGKLDFDYAPYSMLYAYTLEGRATTRRQYLNISQEGKSAIDDLRDQNFLKGIKMESADMLTTNGVQVSSKGLDLLQAMPPLLRLEVDEFLFIRKGYDPPHLKKDLKNVISDEEGFLVVTLNGFEERSGVTEVEDVSYVTSPFLPWLLRRGENAMTDNSERAWESGQGLSQVKGDLNENLILAQVHLVIEEWVPYAANDFSSLLDRLGARTRHAGGRFTAFIDPAPNNQTVWTAAGLTDLTLLDFDPAYCMNSEAEILFPEAPGVTQIEHVGIHIAIHGTVAYGVRVEAIGPRLADDISIDLLSRMLVDLQQDSSAILNDILTENQRRMINVAYRGDASTRPKYLVLFADKVEPMVPAKEYVDHGDNENELKQVLGEVWGAYDIGEEGYGDVVVVGSTGMMIVGSKLRKYDRLTFIMSEAMSILLFISALFSRVMMTQGEIAKLKDLIMEGDEDPAHFDAVTKLRNTTSKEVAMQEELLAHLSTAIQHLNVPPMPSDDGGKKMYHALDLARRVKLIEAQTRDIDKLLAGCRTNISVLGRDIKALQAKREVRLGLEIEKDTERMMSLTNAKIRILSLLDLAQMVLAGSFSLMFLDAFVSARARYFSVLETRAGGNGTMDIANLGAVTGDITSAVDTESVGNPLESSGGYFPLQWALALDNIAFFNLLLHLVALGGMLYLLRAAENSRKHGGLRTVNVKLDRKINPQKFEKYLRQFLSTVLTDVSSRHTLRRVEFTPHAGLLFKWRGAPPRVIVKADLHLGFLLSASFTRFETPPLWRWLVCTVILRRKTEMDMKGNLDDHLLDTLLADLESAG